jgi:hypothetical protein
MSLIPMLDDAAAEATAGLRIDLPGAQRQADERRILVRRRASAAMAAAVAVAAVVTLIAVLVPGGLSRAVTPVPSAPSGAPTGLPDHWYYAPPWTPPVTRHPMAAASMVLAAPLAVSAQSQLDGPVLVSADGTGYASLPWDRGDGLVALAASGADVAWVSQSDGSGSGPDRAVVHRIHLADGRRRDVELPAGVQVYRLLWAAARLYVIGENPTSRVAASWVLAPGSDALVRATELPLGGGDRVPRTRTATSSGDLIVSPGPVRDPSGTRTAEAVAQGQTSAEALVGRKTFVLRLQSGSAPAVEVPITGSDSTTDARVLGWAAGGIVVRMHGQDDEHLNNRTVSLRLYTPDGSLYRVISRKWATLSYPVAVATDVVATGKTVPGVQPAFSDTDRSHLWFLWRVGWAEFGGPISVAGAAVLLAGAVLILRRRRGRRAG